MSGEPIQLHNGAALKQYMELANTIANQAYAIVQAKIPGPQLYAQVSLIENNVKTLKAWTPHPDSMKERKDADQVHPDV